jgi:hypothetical protein
MALKISQQIVEKSSNIKSMKILQVGAELFHPDGWMNEQVEGQT